MPDLAITVIGYVAAALGAVRAVPQWRRLRSLKDSSGVSPMTWCISVCSGIMWTGYSIAIASPPLVIGTGISLAGSAAVLVTLSRLRRGLYREWTLVAGALALTCVVAPINVELVGWVASAASVAMRIPQLVMTLRTGHSAGLSVTTWVLGMISSACWVIYGISIGSGPVVAADAWALLSAAIIVVASRRGRSRTLAARNDVEEPE